MSGFKVKQEHKFTDFSIYEITADVGAEVHFKMRKDQCSIGTYYDGRMVVTDAFNKSIIGWVLEGWMNKPELDTQNAWYTSKVEVEMKNWLCVHSDKYTKCDVKGEGEPSATVNGVSFWLS
jgi:hypothetical protein